MNAFDLYRTAPPVDDVEDYRPPIERPEPEKKSMVPRLATILKWARGRQSFTNRDVAAMLGVENVHASMLCHHAVAGGHLELLKHGKRGPGGDPAIYRHRTLHGDTAPITKEEFIAMVYRHANNHKTTSDDFRAMVIVALKRI